MTEAILTMNTTAHPAERILLGPGPSPVPERVLRAMSAPTLGHLDLSGRGFPESSREAPACKQVMPSAQTKVIRGGARDTVTGKDEHD